MTKGFFKNVSLDHALKMISEAKSQEYDLYKTEVRFLKIIIKTDFETPYIIKEIDLEGLTKEEYLLTQTKKIISAYRNYKSVEKAHKILKGHDENV